MDAFAMVMYILLKFQVSGTVVYKVVNRKSLKKCGPSTYSFKSGPLQKIIGQSIFKHSSQEIVSSFKNNIVNNVPKILLKQYIQENEHSHFGLKTTVTTPDDESCIDLSADAYPNEQVLSTSGTKNNSSKSSVSRGFRVPSSNEGTKKYFCIFCKRLTAKLPRHLELIHPHEPEVLTISSLSKGSQERKRLLENIRKKGIFEYNCSADYNIEKELIVSRRPQATKNRIDRNYECCPNCHAFFSKLTLRHHFKKCCRTREKGQRNITIPGRQARLIVHQTANPVLKEEVLPVLRDDEITDAICKDKLILIFGNKMLQKYRAKYHHKMIRARLRCLGRFLVALAEKCSKINSLTDIYNPQYYDIIIETVNELAGLNSSTGKYKVPSLASMIGMLIKKVGNLLISECVKQRNNGLKKSVKDFLKLFKVDYGTAVNKTVQENQLEFKRRKEIELPSITDIQKLKEYLDKNRELYYNKLKRKFTFESWKQLASYTLTTLQLFNRRRAGEIQRIMVEDIERSHNINDGINSDLYNSLSSAGRQAADQYSRCVIRGKLARGVPILFHKSHLMCIKIIINYRDKAKVPAANPYLFGIPGNSSVPQTLDACVLMRQYASECGAENPHTLRGTKLRKHIATQAVLLNLKEAEISDLASFMGHADKIHKDHYRMPVPAREITTISRLLEAAQGDLEQSEGFNQESTVAMESKIASSEDTANEISTVDSDTLVMELELTDQGEAIILKNPEHHILINNDAELKIVDKNNALIVKEKNKETILNEEYNEETNENSRNDIENISEKVNEEKTDEICRNDTENISEKVNEEKTNKICRNDTENILEKVNEEKTHEICRNDTENICVISKTNEEETNEYDIDSLDNSERSVNTSEWLPENNMSSSASSAESSPEKKKVRKTSRKLTWSTPERTLLRQRFSEHIKKSILPSGEECEKLVRECPLLQTRKRTGPKVKAWVNNYIRRLKMFRKGSLQSWNTPQKEIVREHFDEYFKKKKLPSVGECRQALEKYEILKGKKPAAIKSWISAELNRRAKESIIRQIQF